MRQGVSPPAERIPLIARAAQHLGRTALIDETGRLTYAALLARSAGAAAVLLADHGADLGGARVAFLTPPGLDYVVAQWAIWRAGGVAVPLCTTHPAPELDYVLGDCGASLAVVHPAFAPLLEPLARERGARVYSTAELAAPAARAAALPDVAPERGAMLLYTSGTTGRPKAVLSTHAMLAAQIGSIVTAWEWSERDHILHVLPLHHLHGILNALCCALWSGACCELLPRFDAERVWREFSARSDLTLFMAVPTIYAKLAQSFEQAGADERARRSAGCRRLRLMVSGSAALPVAVLESFAAISGHILLERYGMTEFGMGLGNPLRGERRPGHVGAPFPGIDVRLVDEHGAAVPDGEPGQIQVRGPGVFREYFGKPDATRAAFTPDGWFKTGDVALVDRGAYRILGRESVDILKTGGYKVSALEIEEALREHPAIRECAVVGVADETWGQRVAAVVVLNTGASLELDALRAWSKQRLAAYKVPALLRVVAELPRNAMGKVQKPDLARAFAAGGGA
jgi:malonyl-CoA/methylmalonyl-CoA synthetase